MQNTPSAQSVARGAVTVIAMRWTDRLIGILSTFLLARLLVPADFGIVAVAALVVALVDALLDLGVAAALVRNPTAERADFDTAWTLQAAQSIVSAVLIAAVGAPLAADYFGDERLTTVLRVMALSLVFSGTENIGLVTYQKNMEFGLEFRFRLLRRLAGFIVTMALAFWLRSYWAMIFGTLAGRVVGCALSYWLHDYRPRLSLARLGAFWSFSQWILVRNVGTYGTKQLDKIIVGRQSGVAPLGAYALADEIAALPTQEVLAPTGRVLFPALVRVIDDPPGLRRMFLLAMGVQSLVALPVGIGLSLVAPQAVPLLLGEQWGMAIPIVQILSLASITAAMSHGPSYLLLALGRVRTLALITWWQVLAVALLALVIFPGADSVAIAGFRLAVSVGTMLVLLILVRAAIPLIQLRDLLGGVMRPLVAATGMAAALLALAPSGHLASPVAGLLADVLAGGVVYGVLLALLWRGAGCAEGAEAYLLDQAGLRGRVVTLLGRR